MNAENFYCFLVDGSWNLLKKELKPNQFAKGKQKSWMKLTNNQASSFPDPQYIVSSKIWDCCIYITSKMSFFWGLVCGRAHPQFFFRPPRFPVHGPTSRCRGSGNIPNVGGLFVGGPTPVGILKAGQIWMFYWPPSPLKRKKGSQDLPYIA